MALVYTIVMRLYNTRDLQRSTKEILDAATRPAGGEAELVIIQRGDTFFKLVEVEPFPPAPDWGTPKAGVAEIDKWGEAKVVHELEDFESLNSATTTSKKTKGDLLAEIRTLEASRDNELRFCQDEEIAAKISSGYAEKIKPLWEDYHLLKEAD